MDDVRTEARLEALRAVCNLEQALRDDDGLGGVDAIVVGVLSQQVSEKVRVYRFAVNIGEEPEFRTWLAEIESDRRRGMGRRRWDL